MDINWSIFECFPNNLVRTKNIPVKFTQIVHDLSFFFEDGIVPFSANNSGDLVEFKTGGNCFKMLLLI